MNIWLITIGEPWPTDLGAPRLLRAGINARYLAHRHQVTWWNSTFDHTAKCERSGANITKADQGQGYDIIGLSGGIYRRNVSLERIRYHRKIAKNFKLLAARMTAPDIIVVSLTPLELAYAAVEYGRQKCCPVVVDVRDMWPDIWADQLPSVLRPARQILLGPFYQQLWKTLRGAFAVTGITDAAVDWGLKSIGRPRGPLDVSFPLAYESGLISPNEVSNAELYWRQRGVGQSGQLVGCFFGTFTPRVDFETPLEAMKTLPSHLRENVQLVFCGAGEMKDRIASYARHNSNIIVPGWMDATHIRALMNISSFGLLPYRPSLDFVRSLPNKVFEYLSGGLPIITSLRGEIERLFAEFPCGGLYTSNDAGSFQRAIANLVYSPHVRDSLSRAAKKANAHYDSKIVCDEFEKHLETVDKAFRKKSAKRMSR